VAATKQLTWGYAAPKPTIYELLASRERMNRVSVDFLKIDLEIALTFARIAGQTRENSRRKGNCRSARRAYDNVVNLIQKVDLNSGDCQALQRKLAQLKTELEALGERF
jgi:hypothetical protein